MLLYLFRKRSRNNNDSCCRISDTPRFEQKNTTKLQMCGKHV